jgi:hypothetical protein
LLIAIAGDSAALRASSTLGFDNPTYGAINLVNSTLTASHNLVIGGPNSSVYLGDSTLDLREFQLVSQSLLLFGNSSILQSDAGGFCVVDLLLGRGMNYVHDDRNIIEKHLSVTEGAKLTAANPLNLRGTLLVTDANSSCILESPLKAFALEVVANSVAEVPAESVVEVLGVVHGARLTVLQSPSVRSGITVTSPTGLVTGAEGILELAFDAEQSAGVLDWGLRWTGEHVGILAALLGSEIVATGAPRPVGVIYDPARYGDFTYVGFVGVPEPAACALLLIALGTLRNPRGNRVRRPLSAKMVAFPRAGK